MGNEAFELVSWEQLQAEVEQQPIPLGEPPVCPCCESRHYPDYPHDPGSWAWWMRFEDAHGRPPRITDTFAHLSPERQAGLRAALVRAYLRAGLPVPEELR